MTENEPGSDSMLPDDYDPTPEIEAEEHEHTEEDARLEAIDPASVADEPGDDFEEPPPPDPAEPHDEYDPTPEPVD